MKGPSELRSSAVEALRVQIDGVPYPIPAGVTGVMIVSLPDPFTKPPAPKPAAAAAPPAAAPKARKSR